MSIHHVPPKDIPSLVYVVKDVKRIEKVLLRRWKNPTTLYLFGCFLYDVVPKTTGLSFKSSTRSKAKSWEWGWPRGSRGLWEVILSAAQPMFFSL